MKSIVSRENADFKALRLLAKDTREQRRQGRTVIDGLHLVADYRRSGGVPERLVISESGAQHPEVQALLACHEGVDIVHLKDALFGEISGVASPVGLLATIIIPPDATAPISDSALVLEGIQDAGNLGTMLRTAAAAGVHDIVLGPGCAGIWTPRVLRAGQGAHFLLAIRQTDDLNGFVVAYGGRSVAAVAAGGQSLYDLDLREPIAWIFGNEGAGLSPPLAAAAMLRASIPMAAGSESLNVASAAAVCLFEALRQRSRT